jgi:acyl carrier protein
MMALTADDLLTQLQVAYDQVKQDVPRRLRRDDDVTDDLEIDSLDFIDLVSLLEEDLGTDVVEAVIDDLPDLRTVGEIVDAFLRHHG